MNISVVGAGYVGLVTAAGLAEKGHTVVCVDVDEAKLSAIQGKKSPIFEKGLDKILETVVPAKLTASGDLRQAVLDTELTFICVGTPSGDGGEVDLTHVEKVSQDLGKILAEKKDYHVIVVKSTVAPGSSEDILIPILERESGKRAGSDFGVCMNPEFLREGVAVQDFMNPDRIVIGSIDQKSGNLLESVYYGFTSPVLRVSLKTAEMIKYTSNSLLATKISFINEVGNVCKRLGVDVYDVAKGVGLDHRISPNFLAAGPGFGGSCFPKDVAALVYKARKLGVEPILLESVLEVNRRQAGKVVELIKAGGDAGKKIAVLGLAFKPDTDDVRESPAIPIIEGLLGEGAEIVAYDPKAAENARKVLGDKVKYAASATEAISQADVILFTTEWEEFSEIDFNLLKGKVIYDTRKAVNTDLLPDGVKYEGLCW